MRKLTRGVPSPAMGVAVIALFVALGGTGYATVTLVRSTRAPAPRKHKQVPPSDTAADRALVHKMAPGLSVASAKSAGSAAIAANANHAGTADSATSAGHAVNADNAANAGHATNADNAANAGHATSADSATNATTVGGLAVVKFARSGTASSPVTILNLAGLQLQYVCTSGSSDALYLTATTTSDGSKIWLSRTADQAYLESKDPFNSGTTFALPGFVGTAVYTGPAGQVVTLTYRNTLNCAAGVAGTAYGG